jgi:transposase
MAKYEQKYKLSIVEEYLTGRVGYKVLSNQYGVHASVIRQWVGYYKVHGVAGLSKKCSHYTAHFKLSVLQRMSQQRLSYQQMAILYDLRGGAGVVSNWARLYRVGGLDALQPQPRGRPKQMKPPQTAKPDTEPVSDSLSIEELRKENAYLRAEVAYLKKLDALIRTNQQAAQPKRKS